MDLFIKEYHEFAGCVLFPLRLFLGVSTLSFFTIINLILNCIPLNTGLDSNVMCSIILQKIMGITLHIQGEENIRLHSQTPCIIVSNHINHLDPMIHLLVQRKSQTFLTKNIYTKFPFSLLFGKKPIPCDKEKATGAVFKIKNKILEGGQVTMFPDGCNVIPPNEILAPFRRGAFAPKEPVLPIVIRYVPSTRKNMNWNNDQTLLSLTKEFFLDGDIHVYVSVLPLETYKDEYDSSEEYKNHVFDRMESELSKLPKQTPSIQIQKKNDENIFSPLCNLLYLSLLNLLFQNTYWSTLSALGFIFSYFRRYYPTGNTRLLDDVFVSYCSYSMVSYVFLE
jgi:1-acyl-sn-glycerol-3-phosphate acyltransferase